jgi:ferrochelatase
MGFQSRFGRIEWLKPYTEDILREHAKQGSKRLTVLCPGFAVDCLETLEEIALRNRADFLAAGGESFEYVPALNAQLSHVEALAKLVMRCIDAH